MKQKINIKKDNNINIKELFIEPPHKFVFTTL